MPKRREIDFGDVSPDGFGRGVDVYRVFNRVLLLLPYRHYAIFAPGARLTPSRLSDLENPSGISPRKLTVQRDQPPDILLKSALRAEKRRKIRVFRREAEFQQPV